MSFPGEKTPKNSEGTKAYSLHPEDIQIHSVLIPAN